MDQATRSPFENVLQILPQGHDKSLQQAFYNAGATLFVVIVCGAAVAVYYILEIFLEPLLWAILCGSVLYPFKNRFTGVIQGWFKRLRISGRPLVVGIAFLPFEVADQACETVGNIILNQLKTIFIIAICLSSTYVLYYFGPLRYLMLTVIPSIWYLVYEILGYFSAIWVWTLVISYVVIVLFYWNENSSSILRILAVPVWAAILFHISSIFGYLRIPIFLLVIIIFTAGFVAEIKEAKKRFTESSPSTHGAEIEAMSPAQFVTGTLWKVWTNVNLNQSKHSSMDSSVEEIPDSAASSPQEVAKSLVGSSSDDSIEVIRAGNQKTPDEEKCPPVGVEEMANKSTTDNQHVQPLVLQETPITRTESIESEVAVSMDQVTLSDQCFMVLLYAVALVMVWRHFMLIMPLIPLLMALIIIKKLFDKFGSRQWVKIKYQKVYDRVTHDPRFDVLAPGPIQGLGKLLLRGDRKVVKSMEQSMDKVVSILIILLLFIGLFLLTFFIAVQVQRESMHLVTLTGNVFNNSVHPELKQWLPDGDEMQKTVDSMVGNAHHYGRQWITTKLNNAFNGDMDSKDLIEKQVLELWDKIYELWFTRHASQDGSTKAVPQNHSHSLTLPNFSDFWQAVKDTDFTLNIYSMINENIDLLLSVFQSIWMILKSNISLATQILTAVLSAILGGGTAILNFVLAFVVFVTTLFYLLSFSTNQYKPMEWLQKISPGQDDSSGKFGKAVEEAIASVFMASLKMAAFYGMYTWLTHTVFDTNIVYIPSALAAIFAAIPFLGTYWAAVPAVIELWLVNGSPALALLLLVFHLVPTYVVDTAIYSEIKGGHPYLTGLAIAGGIYWLGLEGAIIGPILLCSLIVAMNVYGSMMQTDANATSQATGLAGHHSSQQQKSV